MSFKSKPPHNQYVKFKFSLHGWASALLGIGGCRFVIRCFRETILLLIIVALAKSGSATLGWLGADVIMSHFFHGVMVFVALLPILVAPLLNLIFFIIQSLKRFTQKEE